MAKEAKAADRTISSLRALTDVLEDFEQRESFELYEVAYAVRALAREWEAAGKELPDMHAEWLAFDEDGPLGPNQVTPDVVNYWEGRARAARHPMLRARYADLVWDLGRRLKRRVPHDLPRIAIDATVECAKSGRFEHHQPGFTRLRRALALALSLRDRARATAVADALVTYEERVADDHLPGTWGVAFRHLVEAKPKGVDVAPETVERIVGALEARLQRLIAASPTEGKTDTIADPFAVEGAALPLARHYRRLARPDHVRRVLLAYGTAFGAAADRVNSALAMAWLEDVFEQYRNFGLSDAAVALTVRLRKLGPLRAQEIKDRSGTTTIRIREGDARKCLAAMTEGTLDEVLGRLTDQFTPNKQEITDEVARTAMVDPLSEYVSRKMTDWEGRKVAEIGSVKDDLDGRGVQLMAQSMARQMWWLRGAVEWTQDRLHPSVADILSYLLRSPVFDPRRAPILERGLAAYLAGAAIVAVPMLIPQIENAVRNIVRFTDDPQGSTYTLKRHRNGGVMLKNFEDLLHEPAVIRALTVDTVRYFQVVFTDQRGWNLRNNVCHGITPAEAFGMGMADRVFHALLVLARVRWTA